MRVLTSDEIYEVLEKAVKEAKRSVLIASAWLKGSALEGLFSSIPDGIKELKVVLRASELQDLLITDERVFELIREKGGEVYLHPRLHAKFVLVDGERAIVGSANFTYSGLSEYEKGNVEAAVYYDANDDIEEVERLLGYFERIVEDGEAVCVDGELLGFSMNPVKPRSFEFALLEEASEQDFVEVRSSGRRLIGRIKEIYSYDMDFFANPFTAGESKVFAPIEVFKTLFAKGKNPDWKKAAVLAYLNANGAGLKIAVVEVVGELVNGRLETPLRPFEVASPVYRISEESLGELLKKNFSGRLMERPVKVGKLAGSKADAFVDASEVLSKHILILGTTGSGKSYFTKLFLKRLLEADPEVKVFVLDPHGEYGAGLRSFGVAEEWIDEISIPDLFLPTSSGEVEELLKENDGSFLISGKGDSTSRNKARLNKLISPSLRLTGFRNCDLKEIIEELEGDEEKKRALIESLGPYCTGQRQLINSLENGITSSARVTIFTFSQVTDANTRAKVAGLVMKELFERAKEGSGRRAFLVLEEAHNFAPERGSGDVSSSKNNLALAMARKIASEGRKFNLGLGVITQRPAQVSKFVLSQTNTQVMFRTINSSDLDAVSSFVEYAGEDVVSLLPSLQTGMGVVCGLGVPFPLLIKIE